MTAQETADLLAGKHLAGEPSKATEIPAPAIDANDPGAVRSEVILAIRRLGAACRHCTPDGRKIGVDRAMIDRMVIHGASVDDAKKAFDQFQKTGHWSPCEGVHFGEVAKQETA